MHPATASPPVAASFDLLAALSAAGILDGLRRGGFAPVQRFAASRAVTLSAALAYAVYLLHWPVLQVTYDFIFKRLGVADLGTARAGTAFAAVGFALTRGAAFVAHRFIERPFLSAKERLRQTTL